VGSRPDGWWRDRAGAAARLLERIAAALHDGSLHGPVTVVLEGAASRAGRPATRDDLRIVTAPASGDDAVVNEVAKALKYGKRAAVVTADRGLKERVLRLGARVEAPSRFLHRIDREGG
jgi:hypothetical protein